MEAKWCLPSANGRIFVPEGLVKRAVVWGPMVYLLRGFRGAAQETLPHSLPQPWGVGLEAQDGGTGVVASPLVAEWWE